MNARPNPGRLFAGLAIVFLLAGCGGGESPTPVPLTPAPSAAAAAVAVTPAAPDRTYVSGTMSCRGVGEEDPTAADTAEYGDLAPFVAYIDCDYTMSDPRVTGTANYELLVSFVELEALNGTSNFWTSTTTLTGQGGTWAGSGFGSEFVSEPLRPMTLFTSGTDLLQGEGAFAGLTYRVLWARETPLEPGRPYVVSGWIEPAE